jgi:hypothetical protein
MEHVPQSRHESHRCRPARLTWTARGLEVRCPAHGHLLGILIGPAQLQIKCGRDEYVIVNLSAPRGDCTPTA